MKILVTGSKGMLGHAIKEEFKDYELILTDIEELDITKEEIKEEIKRLSPDIVLHLAAYTDVDGCEINKDKAYLVNFIGTKNVVDGCKIINIPIVYISTDYVFDGEKPLPYYEWDKPNPINFYGYTKLLGELYVKQIEKYWIIRTSGLYGKGNNFVTTIIEKTKNEKEIRVVYDQIGSPTYTKDLAKAIKEIIKMDYGIYHITNKGWLSWFDFSKMIVDKLCLCCKIIPINSSQINRPAKRPKNWRLFNSFYTNMRKVDEALSDFLLISNFSITF